MSFPTEFNVELFVFAIFLPLAAKDVEAKGFVFMFCGLKFGPMFLCSCAKQKDQKGSVSSYQTHGPNRAAGLNFESKKHAKDCYLCGVGDLMAKAAAAAEGVNHLTLAWGFMKEGTKLRPTGASNAFLKQKRRLQTLVSTLYEAKTVQTLNRTRPSTIEIDSKFKVAQRVPLLRRGVGILSTKQLDLKAGQRHVLPM